MPKPSLPAEMKKVPTQFKLSHAHRDHLSRRAREYGINMTQVVESLIDKDLKSDKMLGEQGKSQ